MRIDEGEENEDVEKIRMFILVRRILISKLENKRRMKRNIDAHVNGKTMGMRRRVYMSHEIT